MSKIIKFGSKNNNKTTPENRLEITIKLLNRLITDGAVSKEEETPVIQKLF